VSEDVLMRDGGGTPLGGERSVSIRLLLFGVALVAAIPFAAILVIEVVSGSSDATGGLVVAVALVAILLVLGAGWVVGRNILGPVNDLARAARSAVEGGAHAPIAEVGPRELAELARAFNSMLSLRSEADAALREAEERYRTLVEGIPGIVYLDGLGVVAPTYYVSPQVETILGYTPADYLANPSLWVDRLHPADRERAVAGTEEQERTGEPMTVIYRMLARDGRVVWLRDRSSLIRDPDGTPRYVLGVMFDVTAEREIAAELAQETADRLQVADALVRMRGGGSAAATAASIVSAVTGHFQTPFAAVVRFTGPETAEIVADRTPKGANQDERQIAPHNARHLIERAAGGAWVEELVPEGPEDPWGAMGLRFLACAPINTGSGTIGVLVAGSAAPDATAERLARRLPALAEFAAVAGQLLSPQLHELETLEAQRAGLRAIIESGALRTVFQPIVRLGDGAVVGYEALTRFSDEVRPDVRFADATAAGVVHELEDACARSALSAAVALPFERWVSINMTPAALITDPTLLSRLADVGRQTVVEITEQVAVGDYASLRRALRRRPPSVELAVDDAGAGFASLRHILELGPRYVKLDMALVRGIAEDPARQALIAGMVHFASAVGCSLIAEGVETQAESGALIGLGVPYAQGFLFGRPADASEFVESAA
jgi:PAS domain S-box-containing protein